jgi:hypothetical protein
MQKQVFREGRRMKSETAHLLKKHFEAGKFTFAPIDTSVQVDYDLSDAEVKEIVETEYGTALSGPVEDLFKVIVKKLLSLGIEHAKKSSI